MNLLIMICFLLIPSLSAMENDTSKIKSQADRQAWYFKIGRNLKKDQKELVEDEEKKEREICAVLGRLSLVNDDGADKALKILRKACLTNKPYPEIRIYDTVSQIYLEMHDIIYNDGTVKPDYIKYIRSAHSKSRQKAIKMLAAMSQESEKQNK